MAIYSAKNSLLKVENAAGSGVFVNAALLTQLSIDNSTPAITATGLLFHADAQHVAAGFSDLSIATISASGFASDDSSLAILRGYLHNRTVFLARFYVDAASYFEGSCKISSGSFSSGFNDPVQLSMTLSAVNVTSNF